MSKTTLLLTTFTLLIAFQISAQPFEDIPSSFTGVGRSYVAWGDFDQDGDLDAATCGITTSGTHLTQIYRNDQGLFVDISAGLIGVKDGSLEWGDYDNDADLDLLITGETYDEGNISLIYRNNEGVFEEYDAGFAGVGYGHGAWGDYDNDGDLDVLITGNWMVHLYRNDDGNFELVSDDLHQLQNSRASWGDFDNDGDLDLLLIGDTGGGYFSGVYLNDKGSFTFTDLGMVGVFSGTIDWVDYDNDGDLDISITGFDIYLEPLFLVYTNHGDGTVDSLSHTMEGVSTSAVDWGDYDNDGDLDVLMSGKTGCCGGNATKIYRNDPDGFNEELNAGISGSIRSGVAWADYDNDGDLDFLLTGMTPSEEPYSKMILNAAGTNDFVSNTVPTSPLNLNASVDGNNVLLSWDKASDAQTPQDGLSYNLRVGTFPGGSDVFIPMADASSGYRIVQAIGNTNMGLSRMIMDLPEGTYYWNVQAIDQAYCGSLFADEQSFSIIETDISELDDNKAFKVYPNPFRDKVYVQFEGAAYVDYRLFNINGQEISNGKTTSESPINLSSMTEGVYFLHLQNDLGTSIQRLIKQ